MKRVAGGALNTTLVILGILSAGFGLKGFLLSSHFIDGGVTGISMLLADVFGWPLSILILLINLPFIALGYRQIGRSFAIKSTLAIAGLSACLALVKYPDVKLIGKPLFLFTRLQTRRVAWSRDVRCTHEVIHWHLWLHQRAPSQSR